MTVEEATTTTDIWPDNVEAANLFIDLASQWRTSGMGGAVGLDYNVLYRKLDRMKLTPVRYDELEEEVRMMEFAAMEVMRKK